MSGQETTLLIVVAAAIVILLLVYVFMRRQRTQKLRDSFGEEYDRTVDVRGGRSKAEADLIERRERVAKLDIRPLTPAERDRFATDWTATKALFVDSPVEAVSRADRLLTEVMTTRGYPMGDFDKRHADLTVEHGDVAKHYLAGHEIADRSSDATTEELRRAINHFEALFSEMTRETAEAGTADRDGDGVPDRVDGHVDADRDGVDDRVEAAPVRPASDPELSARDRY